MTASDLKATAGRLREAGERRQLSTTDLGNSERLVHDHGKDLRYSTAEGWRYYDGRRWALDDTGEVARRAKASVRRIHAEVAWLNRQAARTRPDVARKEILAQAERLARHGQRSEDARRIEAMVRLARSDEAVACRRSHFDGDPWLLNVLNGTIDLRTGELRSHERDDMLTLLAPVRYEPSVKDPAWERTVLTMMGGCEEMVAFLRRAAGYSMTGDTREEVLFFVHGPTAAGKSTFVEAIKATLGDYARTANFESFLKRRSVGGPRDDIASLAGARFVPSIEVDEGSQLAEGLVKTLTGGDTIRCRHIYEREFEYRPEFKLWLVANHEPEVRPDDDAIWRRVLRLPFECSVPVERRDPELKRRLTDPSRSGSAILAWLVQGAREWQERGLDPPRTVVEATEAYRVRQDPVSSFIAERCVQEAGARVASSALWSEFCDWTSDTEQSRILDRGSFARSLRRAGFEPVRTAGARMFAGLRFRNPTDP